MARRLRAVPRLSAAHHIAAGLAWLGRQGPRAIAALVLVGIALPPIDRVLKPFVAEAIFLLLCIAFLRVDPSALRGYLGRPGPVLAATAWTMVVIPTLVGVAGWLIGLDSSAPELFVALMLQAVASPMMAAPSFAALLGLDATLVLMTLVASSALAPLTAPVFAHAFIGPALTLPPVALGAKLLTIVAGSASVAIVLRRLIGRVAIERRKAEIDGLNILVLFVFVAAVMENFATSALARPLVVIGLAALAFVIFFAVLALTTLAFAWAGIERAVALGLMAALRNMGLMVAATSSTALPDLAWLYFALSQFPIYFAPQLLAPLTLRFVRSRR